MISNLRANAYMRLGGLFGFVVGGLVGEHERFWLIAVAAGSGLIATALLALAEWRNS